MGILSTTKRRKTRGDVEYDRPQPLPIGHWLMMTLILIGAFAVRYWFNFIYPHINAYGSCDASEYLRNAGALIEAIKLPTSFWPDSWACLSGHGSPDVVARLQSELKPLQDLRMSGPIFPLFIAWSYALAASPFDMQNWGVPLLSQSLVSSLTCLFIGLTASRAFGKAAGYTAAILAAIYPAFIINSGRLYSETFAAFLLSVLCYVTVRNFNEDESGGSFFRSSLIAGFTAACLQFTRSIMVVLTIALIPITLFQQGIRKGVLGLVGLALGFAIVAAPWVAFQKLAYGSSSLVVDRVGHYNFFVGNNTDTLGWLSVPYPDGRGIDDKPLTQLAKEAYQRNPGHWWSLMLDKPLRLLQFPWNDFRTPIAQVTFKMQVMWHQVILILAGIGIALGFITGARSRDDYDYDRPRSGNQSSTAAKFFLLFVLLIHCSYLFFITVPRYNLTAMVIAMVFAGAGVTSIARLLKSGPGAIAAFAILAAAGFTMVIGRLPFVGLGTTLFGSDHAIAGLIIGKLLAFLSLIAFAAALMMAVSSYINRDSARQPSGVLTARLAVVLITLLLAPMFMLQAHANGRWYEWRCPLNTAGQTITQTFTFPSDFEKQVAGRQLYLLVDADSAADLANVRATINGRRVDSPIIPALSLNEEFDRFQATRHVNMREQEWIWSSLTEATGKTNAELRQWFLYPIPNQLVEGKPSMKLELTVDKPSAGNLYGSYSTSAQAVLIPSVNLYSWEKAFYGGENESGFSDTRYNTRLTSLAADSYARDLSPERGLQSGRYNIHLLAGPPGEYTGNVFVVAPSQFSAYSLLLNTPLSPVSLTDQQPNQTIKTGGLPEYNKDDLWVIRISGHLRRNSGHAKLALNIKLAGQDAEKTYYSPWTANTPYSDDWTKFDVSVPVQPGALPDKPNRLLLAFSVMEPQVSTASGLQIQGTTEFKDVNLQIMRLPSNPLHADHVVF